MIAKVLGKKALGKVVVPPSKSYAHRGVIAASLATGKSVISNVAFSDDINATIDAMILLGAKITKHLDYLEVEGIGNNFMNNDLEVFCNESGSTLRFLIPLFSLTNSKITFKGKNKLLKRPLNEYKKIFIEQGNHFYNDENKVEIKGALKGGDIIINGNVSSQYITGLLFTLPLLNIDSIIHIIPPFESKSYVDITIDLLKLFGIKCEYLDELNIFVKGNQKYQAYDYRVEGDYSQAAFFLTLGAMNGEIEVLGLNKSSIQGDKKIVDILKYSNVDIIELDDGYKVTSKNKIFMPTIDLKDIPDLGPILFVLATSSQNKVRFINTSRLTIKESDRRSAMQIELNKANIKLEILDDDVIVYPNLVDLKEDLYSHLDHRIAMSNAILLVANNLEGIILDAEVVKKSYPNFYEDLKNLGIDISFK